MERDERNQQREHDRIQQDKDNKFRLAQMESEREKEQREREEQKNSVNVRRRGNSLRKNCVSIRE